jgi:hypothetical protein
VPDPLLSLIDLGQLGGRKEPGLQPSVGGEVGISASSCMHARICVMVLILECACLCVQVCAVCNVCTYTYHPGNTSPDFPSSALVPPCFKQTAGCRRESFSLGSLWLPTAEGIDLICMLICIAVQSFPLYNQPPKGQPEHADPHTSYNSTSSHSTACSFCAPHPSVPSNETKVEDYQAGACCQPSPGAWLGNCKLTILPTVHPALQPPGGQVGVDSQEGSQAEGAWEIAPDGSGSADTQTVRVRARGLRVCFYVCVFQIHAYGKFNYPFNKRPTMLLFQECRQQQ